MAENGSRSAVELVMDVADDVRLLLRKEIELARIELMEGLKTQLVGAGLIALAVSAALPGLLFLVIALAIWLPVETDVGFAIVGGGLLAFTGIGIVIGITVMKRRRPSVGKAVGAMKEDVRWAREQISS